VGKSGMEENTRERKGRKGNERKEKVIM